MSRPRHSGHDIALQPMTAASLRVLTILAGDPVGHVRSASWWMTTARVPHLTTAAMPLVQRGLAEWNDPARSTPGTRRVSVTEKGRAYADKLLTAVAAKLP